MTELADMFTVNSTKIREGITGGCLSETEGKKLTVSIDLPGREDNSSNSEGDSNHTHTHLP
jgi:hypothetical protein